MTSKNILIVEDDEDILGLVKYNLDKEGFFTSGITSGKQAIEIIQTKDVKPDLIILDLMLPDLDGFEVCKFLKNDKATRQIPVIMLTAKGEETDIVTGLEIGADDYITKPFSPKVLIARIKAALRRKSGDSIIKIKDLTINTAKHEVLINNTPVKLTRNEFKTLYLLANKPGHVYSRYQIIDELKGDKYEVTDRAVDVMITGLRKKLGTASDYIETVHGIGYKFKEQ